MNMSYHIKQLLVRNFFLKGLPFLENTKTGFLCFLQVEEAASILKILLLILS